MLQEIVSKIKKSWGEFWDENFDNEIVLFGPQFSGLWDEYIFFWEIPHLYDIIDNEISIKGE